MAKSKSLAREAAGLAQENVRLSVHVAIAEQQLNDVRAEKEILTRNWREAESLLAEELQASERQRRQAAQRKTPLLAAGLIIKAVKHEVEVLVALVIILLAVNLYSAYRFALAREAAQYWQQQFITAGRGDKL